jgi:hypothetical protein
MRSKLRSESVRGKPHRCWDSPGCRYRWRAEHPWQPLGRLRICQRRSHRVMKSLSVRKKSRTSAWGRSMSSTRKISHPGRAYNLPEEAVADTAEAAADMAEAPEAAADMAEAAAAEAAAAEAAVDTAAAAEAAAWAAADAMAAAAAVAACRGEVAPSARPRTF